MVRFALGKIIRVRRLFRYEVGDWKQGLRKPKPTPPFISPWMVMTVPLLH